MLDLDQPNHLSPNSSTRNVWKLMFDNVAQLMEVRNQLREIIKSQSHTTANSMDFDLSNSVLLHGEQNVADPWSNIQELREYDVPYTVRVCMDLEIRAGSWFTVTIDQDDGGPPYPTLSNPDIETKANPKVMAFDIECTKAALKFPNAEIDDK